jgi:hypothetical protein
MGKIINPQPRQRTQRHAELVSASIVQPNLSYFVKWTLKQVQGDGSSF